MKVIFKELNHYVCLCSAGLELLRHAVPGRRCGTCEQGRRAQGNTTKTRTRLNQVLKSITVVKNVF